MAKIVSMKNEPVSAMAMLMGSEVTIGIAALRSMWRMTTWRRERPRASAASR